MPIADARPASARSTRTSADGLLAGDELFATPPLSFLQSALGAEIKRHEWSAILQRWLDGKSLELVTFDVVLSRYQLSAPQRNYGNLPPGQAAFNQGMDALFTELKRTERVAVTSELQVCGQRLSGTGIGPYPGRDSKEATVAPVGEALRTLVDKMAQAAAGIQRQ